jgi:hypothetical protein
MKKLTDIDPTDLEARDVFVPREYHFTKEKLAAAVVLLWKVPALFLGILSPLLLPLHNWATRKYNAVANTSYSLVAPVMVPMFISIQDIINAIMNGVTTIFEYLLNLFANQIGELIARPFINALVFTPLPVACPDQGQVDLNGCSSDPVPALVMKPGNGIWPQIWDLFWGRFFTAAILIGLLLYIMANFISTIPFAPMSLREKLKGGWLRFLVALLVTWPLMVTALFLMDFIIQLTIPDAGRLGFWIQAVFVAALGAGGAAAALTGGVGAILTTVLGFIKISLVLITIAIFIVRILFLMFIVMISPILVMGLTLRIPILKGFSKTMLSYWFKFGVAPVFVSAMFLMGTLIMTEPKGGSTNSINTNSVNSGSGSGSSGLSNSPGAGTNAVGGNAGAGSVGTNSAGADSASPTTAGADSVGADAVGADSVGADSVSGSVDPTGGGAVAGDPTGGAAAASQSGPTSATALEVQQGVQDFQVQSTQTAGGNSLRIQSSQWEFTNFDIMGANLGFFFTFALGMLIPIFGIAGYTFVLQASAPASASMALNSAKKNMPGRNKSLADSSIGSGDADTVGERLNNWDDRRQRQSEAESATTDSTLSNLTNGRYGEQTDREALAQTTMTQSERQKFEESNMESAEDFMQRRMESKGYSADSLEDLSQKRMLDDDHDIDPSDFANDWGYEDKQAAEAMDAQEWDDFQDSDYTQPSEFMEARMDSTTNPRPEYEGMNSRKELYNDRVISQKEMPADIQRINKEMAQQPGTTFEDSKYLSMMNGNERQEFAEQYQNGRVKSASEYVDKKVNKSGDIAYQGMEEVDDWKENREKDKENFYLNESVQSAYASPDGKQNDENMYNDDTYDEDVSAWFNNVYDDGSNGRNQNQRNQNQRNQRYNGGEDVSAWFNNVYDDGSNGRNQNQQNGDGESWGNTGFDGDGGNGSPVNYDSSGGNTDTGGSTRSATGNVNGGGNSSAGGSGPVGGNPPSSQPSSGTGGGRVTSASDVDTPESTARASNENDWPTSSSAATEQTSLDEFTDNNDDTDERATSATTTSDTESFMDMMNREKFSDLDTVENDD